MKSTLRFSFYKIEKCGLYKRGRTVPVHGEIIDLLDELYDYLENKPIGETCTYAIEESDSIGRTFCISILKSQDICLLVTWNEVKNENGKISTIPNNTKFGSPKVGSSNIGIGLIPGYASYFIFFKRTRVLATISESNGSDRRNGKQALEKYITEFLSKVSSFSIKRRQGSLFKIDGYIDEENTKTNLNSYFKVKPIRKPSEIDKILSNPENINRIHRKNRILHTTSVEEKLNFFNLLGFKRKSSTLVENELNYHLNVDFKPNEDELLEIIANWENSQGESKWDNVGFSVGGESSIIWLNNSLVKSDLTLDINLDEETGFIEPKSLFEEVSKKSLKLEGIFSEFIK